jgi:hypothetical protein
MNATYTRGTATTKITTNRLRGGEVLLTAETGHSDLIAVAASKTGATLRTVATTERVAPGPFERNTRVVVQFTDGTRSMRLSASQTWMTVVAPAAEPAPAPEVTEETPAAAEETKAYRIGKLLRTWVLHDRNGSYDPALVAHIDAANVCYDGTATLRLTPRWAEILVDAASDMDAEHKAAARAARRTLYALFA